MDRREGLWSASEFRSTVTVSAVGVAILVWAWWDASGSAELDEQTTDLVIALFGVMAVIRTLFAWTRNGRRLVRERRMAFLSSLGVDAGGLGPIVVDESASAEGAATLNGNARVIVPGTGRFHRPDCLLVRSKAVELVSSRTAAEPCEMCGA